MAPRISRYWSNWKVSSPRTLLNHPLRQIFWHKTQIPPQLGSHCIGLATLFLGTCQFLGTTMLFFRKFMMRATFYIFIICPYDVSEKSYSHLKPRFKTWKKADFAFSKNLNLTPPHFGTNSSTIISSEMCSGTLSWPENIISWPQTKILDLCGATQKMGRWVENWGGVKNSLIILRS